MIHQFNILIHVVAGTLGLLVGIFVLIAPKATSTHVRWGRYFLYLLSVVVITGFLGWLFFRSDPFLFLLTLLAGYNGYTGWRAVRLKEKRATIIDFTIAILALVLGFSFLVFLYIAEDNWNPNLVYSAVGALGLVTIYDISKYLWLHAYLKKGWIYEHIYKIISPFGALLSAFMGNVLPAYQPYSQMLPNVLCWLLILVMIWRQVLKQNNQKVALKV
ncbi:hypothetical protein [Tunicatimonas pelagia]|uniref:hypothetical protein n=1 Tax=Tunicatimonas pelagia TaxID=931531 RepID=UPI0026662400|nr:hypothetical protein [Tunicatimonas pelagia]WKN44480.1 hypothetical protein P0M28_05820 [Tunicatimonas pelagia]